MNLTITKEQLISGLQAVQNVVSTRTTLPILSNVMLQAKDGRLELTATDLDVTINSSRSWKRCKCSYRKWVLIWN
jgi:DNA polymerase-3 subunit beta